MALQPVSAADREEISRLVEIDKNLFAMGRVPRKISVSMLDRYVKLCFEAVKLEEIFELVQLYDQLYREYIMSIKHVYNSTIGWALPSQKACTHLHNAWLAHVEKYPDARFIDVGAGTGIFSYVMYLQGVPREKVIAFDRAEPTHKLKGQRQFWQCVTNVDISPNDLLFVGWGCGTSQIVDDYIWSGGHCLVILGEMEDGCTFPADYIRRVGRCDCEDCAGEWSDIFRPCRSSRQIPHEKLGWSVELHHVPGPASIYSEHISINVQK